MEMVKFDSKVSWIIAMACTFLNFLVLIPTKVSGLFFVEILERYQVSRDLASYPAFTITLMRCLGGPFAGYFAQTFGINEVMILGSLMTALGVSACFFAEDLAVVTICLGLIHGTGIAFSNTFFPQIVEVHFRKHLTLAFGITLAGACLGAFFSPPLLVWIFRNYGTSGGFLIIGALLLNCLPIVLVVNMLSPNRLYNKSGDSIKSKKSPEAHLEMEMEDNYFEGDYNRINNVGEKKERSVKRRKENTDSELRNLFKNKAMTGLVLSKPRYNRSEVVPNKTDGIALNFSDEMPMCNLSIVETGSETAIYRPILVFAECGMTTELKPNSSVHEKKTSVTTDETINEMQYDLIKETIPAKLITNNYGRNQLPSNDCIHSKSKNKVEAQTNKNPLKYRVEEVKDSYPSKDSVCNKSFPFSSASDVSASNDLVDQDRTQQQVTIKNGEIISKSLNTLNARSLESYDPSHQENNKKEDLDIDKRFTTGTNAKESLRIFLDVTYWIIIITQSIHVFVLVIFWTTMIDFSRDKNIVESKEIYLLMTLPIGEILGRLSVGWITDSEYISRINFSILACIMMGFSCSLMAWAQEFYVVMTSIILFGIISSGLVTVSPMIIFEFFDSTNQTMRQASRCCLYGLLCFLNGPLIGYFRGTLGSYAWLYHTMGLVSVACGALTALIPMLARMRDEKKKSPNEIENPMS